jgi:putative FmdB family regulatory protein
MPIYEYLCEACQTQIEIMQKFTDPAPTKCETCGKGPMVKQLSLSSFALKGTGWYVTDYKTKPREKTNERVSGAKSEGDKPGADKPDVSKSDSAATQSGQGESKAESSKSEASGTVSKSEGSKSEAT